MANYTISEGLLEFTSTELTYEGQICTVESIAKLNEYYSNTYFTYNYKGQLFQKRYHLFLRVVTMSKSNSGQSNRARFNIFAL